MIKIPNSYIIFGMNHGSTALQRVALLFLAYK